MERAEIPKLKKAVISLHKLDLSRQVSVAGNGKETHKTTELFDEDPSSENISTGSVESTVVGTDDDDLEKKIQAFSIPVKKDEKARSNSNETKAGKICSDKVATITQDNESSKLGSKPSLSSLKWDAKLKEKSVSDAFTLAESINGTTKQIPEIKNISSGTKGRKDKSSKDTVETESEDKKLTPGSRLSMNKAKKCSEAAKPISANIRATHDNTSLIADGKEDKRKEEKITFAGKKERKGEKDNSQIQNIRRSEVLRKRKIQQDDDTDVEPKNLLKRKNQKTTSETSVSTLDSVEKKKHVKNVETKMKTDTDKKKMLSISSRLSDNDYLKVKRSKRISSRSIALKIGEKHIKEKKKLEVKSQTIKENKQTSSVLNQKKNSSSKDRSDNSLNLKTGNRTESSKASGEKRINIATHKLSKTCSMDSSEPRDKNAKAQQSRLNAKGSRGLKQASFASKKRDDSNAKAPKKLGMKGKSTNLERNLQNNGNDSFDEGEELLEKICDILEDSNGVSECNFGGRKNSMPQVLQSFDDRTVTDSKLRFLVPQPSFFIPKTSNKNSKFPSHSKGSVSYKKLWKWSHYVRLPSDMWSLYKHFNGNFVIILHISETSPFPNLLIDKCVIFKETASPLVKIHGEDVDALGSKEELQTLGQVCSFLKHIHDLSLCQGKSLEGGKSHNNCELYTDKNVSLPYKCKACSCS